jgi:group II intron reverse transcriptase/maturase
LPKQFSLKGGLPLVQESNYLISEAELRSLLDEMFIKTKQCIEQGTKPTHKNLMQLISSEVTILTAIHNIKANKGSRTAGSDGELMRNDILEKEYPDVISRVKSCLKDYSPMPVRRVYIPKPGKIEKRPLGIPAIIDRIIQECVRIVIEPILEAQFFPHSYGFRPMRDAQMALARATDIVHNTGYHWVVEGDISKFFDNVNHTKLVKKLWNMGIHDRRVLMVIKAMLKAGIMNELCENPLGTPQGGIISPLLANAYLDSFDKWVTREWENKQTQHPYKQKCKMFERLRKTSKLKPAYLVRYADDWILITNSKNNAEKWKQRISKYLESELKLTLSEEKTVITNLRDKPIHFLGFDYKVIKGKARKNYIPRTKPNSERLKQKVADIHKETKKLKRFLDKESLIHRINIINSKIRGVIQYYETATWVNVCLRKYADTIHYSAYLALRKAGGFKAPACNANNLLSVHSNYRTKIPMIEYNGLKIGVTRLDFCKWNQARFKNPLETPYTEEGRKIYKERTGKRSTLARADDLLSLHWSKIIMIGHKDKLYNFEYLLNRAYAFNRDKGKCRICREDLEPSNLNIHHIDPSLPMEEVNRVPNLASVHVSCHQMIHSIQNYSELGSKVWNNILKFREKLILVQD